MGAASAEGFVTSEVACAATAFLVWDALINLDQEVEYIWKGPSSWVKWTYVVIRHAPYLIQGSVLTLVGRAGHVWHNKQCEAWIAYQLVGIEVLTIAVEVVLMIRVYAMYNRNRSVLTLVLVFFAAEITAMWTILGISIPQITFTPQCLITSTPKVFPTYWTISLAFETTLFTLTLVRFATTAVASQLRKQSILYLLVRDGTWAYAIIFVVMLLNTLMYETQHNALAGVCYFWEISVMSFAGSHILLNLRRLAMQPHDTSWLSALSQSEAPSNEPSLPEVYFAREDIDITLAMVEMQRLPGIN
ncbi:hypothetical protein C2E23DRAFT_186884 [Lenzites betulinus]|nr:hypothetical protein C2E23DRAFT_186884 [Lenzites betulinus]